MFPARLQAVLVLAFVIVFVLVLVLVLENSALEKPHPPSDPRRAEKEMLMGFLARLYRSAPW